MRAFGARCQSRIRAPVLSPNPNRHVAREIMLAAMARVDGEITVSRPVDAVFDFVADECNEPRYNAPTVRAEQISEGPIGEGARFYTELRMMGRTMPMVVELTGYERPSRPAWVTRSPMMRTEGALTFEPVDEGTRMHWSWDVRPRGAMKLMAPLVAGSARGRSGKSGAASSGCWSRAALGHEHEPARSCWQPDIEAPQSKR